MDSSGTIKYLYDQSKVVLEQDAEDSTLATYTHEGGGLFYDLISVERTNSYWYLFDGLGSVVQMVDASENTQNSYTYEAFGQIKSQTENMPNRYKFVGAYDVYYDATPALYFMQARYYDPWRGGRFITMDPLRGVPQDPLSLHRYLYVRNNPLNWVDPAGLEWGIIGLWIGGTMIALGVALIIAGTGGTVLIVVLIGGGAIIGAGGHIYEGRHIEEHGIERGIVPRLRRQRRRGRSEEFYLPLPPPRPDECPQ